MSDRKAAEIDAAWETRRDTMYGQGATKSARLRLRLAGEQGWRCCYCGCRMTIGRSSQQATIEHIVPRNDGGTNSTSNLVAACIQCNQDRGQSYWPVHIEILDIINAPAWLKDIYIPGWRFKKAAHRDA